MVAVDRCEDSPSEDGPTSTRVLGDLGDKGSVVRKGSVVKGRRAIESGLGPVCGSTKSKRKLGVLRTGGQSSLREVCLSVESRFGEHSSEGKKWPSNDLMCQSRLTTKKHPTSDITHNRQSKLKEREIASRGVL
jgi:hypothetical protein